MNGTRNAMTATRRALGGLLALIVLAPSAGAEVDGLGGAKALGQRSTALGETAARPVFDLPSAVAANDVSCNKIDFEGLVNGQTIGTVRGDIDVDFGSSWISLVDEDAGGFGNFANEPSPSTIASFLETTDPISFSKGVQFVELFYSADSTSLPVTLNAWSQRDGRGQKVATITGNTIGVADEGAPCSGDPNGRFCLFSVLSLTSESDEILSITIEGAAGDRFGFDDMTFCTGEPRVLNETPQQTVAGASRNPSTPRVVNRPDRSRYVVWTEDSGSRRVVRAQLFDVQGASLAGPRTVSSSGTINSDPTAAVDGDGNLVVFWTSEAGSSMVTAEGRVALAASAGTSVVGRFFDPTLSPSTDEVVVSTGNTGDSKTPEADQGKNGDTVVTWDDGGDVRARLLDRRGRLVSQTFPVSGGASKPAVALSPLGEFVIAWRRTSNPRIFAQRFTAAGTKRGGAITVTNSATAENPEVAMSDNGDFIVVWQDRASSGVDVLSRLYRANGQPKGPAQVVNSGVAGDQIKPVVALNAAGDFVVVWESSQASAKGALAGEALVGRIFDPTGTPERADFDVAESDADGVPVEAEVSLDDKDDVTVVYERRRGGNQPGGLFSKRIRTQGAAAPCATNSTTLCLNDGRFRVTSRWQDPKSGDSGVGRGVKLTDDTGYFWFFDSTNVEIVVKTLDACSFANSLWAFAAGLTDVEVNLTIDDTASGESVTYFSSEGAFQPVQDTGAFRTCQFGNSLASDDMQESMRTTVGEYLDDLAHSDAATLEQASSLVCATTSTQLCLNGNRFEVEVDWRTAQGTSGQGRAVKLTNDTGYFWFFERSNVELIVKVLDACAFANRFWAFAGGLTDVRAEVTIRDTETGARKVYTNPQSTAFRPIQDTQAFNTCP
ncbi:MAG: hypothetical protein AAGK22_28275 [Acidobacteriota bacterium]